MVISVWDMISYLHWHQAVIKVAIRDQEPVILQAVKLITILLLMRDYYLHHITGITYISLPIKLYLNVKEPHLTMLLTVWLQHHQHGSKADTSVMIFLVKQCKLLVLTVVWQRMRPLLLDSKASGRNKTPHSTILQEMDYLPSESGITARYMLSIFVVMERYLWRVI